MHIVYLHEVTKVGERKRDFSNASLLKENCHDKSCIVCVRGLSRARKRSHGTIRSCTTVSNATTASTTDSFTDSFTDSECDDCHDDDDEDMPVSVLLYMYIIIT